MGPAERRASRRRGSSEMGPFECSIQLEGCGGGGYNYEIYDHDRSYPSKFTGHFKIVFNSHALPRSFYPFGNVASAVMPYPIKVN